MGNELSVEGGASAQQEASAGTFGLSADAEPFFVNENVCLQPLKRLIFM